MTRLQLQVQQHVQMLQQTDIGSKMSREQLQQVALQLVLKQQHQGGAAMSQQASAAAAVNIMQQAINAEV